MEQRKFNRAVWKLFLAGGWLPVLVFLVHLFSFFVVNIYAYWPRADMPLHFIGGLSIAYFASRSCHLLLCDPENRSRDGLLELVLIISLTATAAVFWEFGEYILDRTFGTNLQVSLLNTMQDLFLGMLGAFVVFALRTWQLKAGPGMAEDVLSEMSG